MSAKEDFEVGGEGAEGARCDSRERKPSLPMG